MSIIDAVDAFNAAGVLVERNVPATFSTTMVTELKGLPYINEWRICREKYWFHALLEGDNFVRFDADSFRFYMSPYKVMSFDDFVEDQIGWDDPNVTEYILDLQHEYEFYVESETEKIPAVPLRVDYHEAGYKKGVHAVCHMHAGIQSDKNEIRIPIRRRLTELDFAYFIVRNFYPEKWDLFLNEPFKGVRHPAAKVSPNVNIAHWDDWDEMQLFLA